MDEQTTFRIVFAALFFLLFGVVGMYRRKAQAGRRIDYSKEGRAIFIALRLGGLLMAGYCLLYILHPRILDWSFVDLPPGRWNVASSRRSYSRGQVASLRVTAAAT